MHYKCKRISAGKLIATNKGFVKSICENCKSGDCTNPIEKRKISMLGVIKDAKLYCQGDECNSWLSWHIFPCLCLLPVPG